ncbi:MAG: SDR family NAD(P)-dependent oxidoreductase, partial [Gammaproteobacteria bacterium]
MAVIPADYIAAPDALKERAILVTGAGDGIGRAVSRGLAAHGATVVLLGKTIKKLESVYDEIMQAGGPMPGIYPMDLRGATYQDHEDLAAVLAREYGRLDGLLHNAG